MIRTKAIAWIAIVILLGAGGFFFLNSEEMPNDGEGDALGKRSADPVFTLTLTGIDGAARQLADFKGENVIVSAWATWCPYCLEELPYLESIQGEYGEKLVILAVNHGEKPETAQRYLDGSNLEKTLIYLFDPNDSFYKAIRGFSMPETIFIDKEGIIQFHKRGPMNREEIRRRAQDIFKI